MQQERNALIVSTEIVIVREILTVWIHLDYGNSGQAFGGHALYLSEDYENKGDIAGQFMYNCMKIAGVSDWSQMQGKAIRVIMDHESIIGIGHIVRDEWYIL